MPEYTASIEAQIDETLRLRGSVGADDIPGIDAVTGAAFLREFAHAHAHDPTLIFDGRTLARRASQDQASGAADAGIGAGVAAGSVLTPSPVDQVMAAPRYRSALDSAPAARPVSRAMWLLPLALGFVGGIVAYFVVRGDDPRVARHLLVAGVVVSVLTMVVPFCVFAGTPFGSRAASDDPWPASTSGAPVFYYFGTSG